MSSVLVIYGGNSAERDISLISGATIGEALEQAGHTVHFFDPTAGLQTLSANLVGIDVIFPILHGTGGEDGYVQRALELEGVPFVGSDAVSSSSCFDKWKTIQQAKQILFPETEIVSKHTIKDSKLLQKPYVIKPRAEGSSVDTFIVRDPTEFDINKLDKIFDKYNDELLFEALIEGQEMTVPVLIDKALPVVEIIPPQGQDFDYSNKYNGATTENCPPQFVSTSLQKQAQAIALKLHTQMGCRHFSRTDMIIDKTGVIYTLEINTLPGMTPESLFPRAAKAAGIELPELVDALVHEALRYNT